MDVDQDVGKNEAATELLKYIDSFREAGFTAIKVKDATPTDISEVLGMLVSILLCTLDCVFRSTLRTLLQVFNLCRLVAGRSYVDEGEVG